MPVAANLYYFFNPSENRSKPPVLLIHGAGGNHLFWPPEVRRLVGYRVYALDLPGHGKSDGIGQQSIPDYTKIYFGFYGCSWYFAGPSWSVTRWVAPLPLIWHSTMPGGWLVSVWWPVVPACGLHRCSWKNAGNATTSPQIIQAIKDFAYSPQTDMRVKDLAASRMVETRPAVLRGDFLACDTFDVRERLGEIGVPTLILVGSDDQMTPLAFSTYMAGKIPGAQMQRIENAGHMLMLEKPREVAHALSGFVEQLMFQPDL